MRFAFLTAVLCVAWTSSVVGDFVNIYGNYPVDSLTQSVRDTQTWQGNGILQGHFGFSKSPLATDIIYTENDSDEYIRGKKAPLTFTDDCANSCNDNPACLVYNFYIWTVHAEPMQLADGGDGVGFGGAVLYDYWKDYFPNKAVCELWDTVPVMPIDQSTIWPIISSQVWLKEDNLLASYPPDVLASILEGPGLEIE